MSWKMNTSLGDERNMQYINAVEDKVNEVRQIAGVIVGSVDDEGAPVEDRVDLDLLKEDYDIHIIRLNSQLAELETAVTRQMIVTQHDELRR